jgi:hypothetical protein
MVYINRGDIEGFTGMTYTDFKVGGVTMTEAQWIDFLTLMIPNIEQALHRYCNVTSFDPSTTLIEYHSGRGATNDEYGSGANLGLAFSGQGTAYIDNDTTFWLRELLYTMTSVYEDTNPKTSVPAWTLRAERTAILAGDYEIVTKNELTCIRFHQNVPAAGNNNVKITYKTGYATTSAQYQEIKLQALRMMSNLLLHKKKIQEALTIRAQGIRDYSQMFDIMNESAILTENIKLVLDKYKRWNIEGDIFA